MNDFNDEMMEKLILDGLVEFAGIEESTGEMLYSFTPKAIEEHPEFERMMMDSQVRDIYTLWELGFLNMNIAEENPLVRVTEKALNPEDVNALPIDLKLSLLQILEISKIDEE